jgi:hypothetical protein
MSVSSSEERSSAKLPDGFVQTGSNIDVEIAIRLTRAMWNALGAADVTLASRLNSFLQDEIDSLTLQNDIDGGANDDFSISVARLLQDYIKPTDG